jgi:tetratricopeptide (TPR) repeat protein
VAVDTAVSDADALVAQAAALYDTHNGEFDFVAYEGRLREAIGLYEQALALVPADDTAALLATRHQLARAYFELANAYIAAGPAQEAAYVAGKDHALASLRLDPDFVAREATSFRAALANANDVGGVFWYGTNFGSYLNYHQLEAILNGGMNDVVACYERAIVLDETFLAGAPLRSLGCYLAQVPSFLGGNLARSRELLARAMTLAPEFLQNAVDLSEWVLKPSGEGDALCTTLAGVKLDAQDSAVMSTWPLYNELALRRAVKLSSDCP